MDLQATGRELNAVSFRHLGHFTIILSCLHPRPTAEGVILLHCVRVCSRREKVENKVGIWRLDCFSSFWIQEGRDSSPGRAWKRGSQSKGWGETGSCPWALSVVFGMEIENWGYAPLWSSAPFLAPWNHGRGLAF